MNPQASDRVREIQDTIIVVGDVWSILKLGATLGAEIDTTLLQSARIILKLQPWADIAI